MSNEVSNPQRRGIENRRKELAKWHRSKEWIAFRDLHARCPGARCTHCGKRHLEWRVRLDGAVALYKSGKKRGEPIKVNLTVNHLSRRKYISLKEYTTWDENCEVCCDFCNKLYEQGKVICPVCKARYIDSNSNDKECDHCYYEKHPDELKEKLENIEARNERNRLFKKKIATQNRIAKQKHPCAGHLVNQGCKYSDFKCEYSAKKAPENCRKFVWKQSRGMTKSR